MVKMAMIVREFTWLQTGRVRITEGARVPPESALYIVVMEVMLVGVSILSSRCQAREVRGGSCNLCKQANNSLRYNSG